MKLKDLLANGITLQNVSLFHMEEDVEEATIVELSLRLFTPAGLEYWSDVLNAEVFAFNKMLEDGVYIWVGEIGPERVEGFQFALAGYCSELDDKAWFQEIDEPKIVVNAALDDDMVFYHIDGTTESYNLKKDEKELN